MTIPKTWNSSWDIGQETKGIDCSCLQMNGAHWNKASAEFIKRVKIWRERENVT